MGLYITTVMFLLCAASGCSQHADSVSLKRCNDPKYEVYLYPTNRSRIDTAASFRLLIDDSLYANSTFRQYNSSSEFFYKKVLLCKGLHSIKSTFGRYVRDTTFVIKGETSLIFLMNYQTNSTHNNGLRIALLERDSTVKAID